MTRSQSKSRLSFISRSLNIRARAYIRERSVRHCQRVSLKVDNLVDAVVAVDRKRGTFLNTDCE